MRALALLAMAAASAPTTFPLPPKDPARPTWKPKPYAAPKIEAEPEVAPPAEKVVEVPKDEEMPILVRPFAYAPMVGAAIGGARLPVRGVWEAPTQRGCTGKRWLALQPFGWICAGWIRRTQEGPTSDPVLKVAEGEVVPFRYVMVGFRTEKESMPMHASIDDLRAGRPPLLQLHKGDTIAVTGKPVKVGDTNYYVAEDGRVLPTGNTFTLRRVSTWQGVVVDDATPLPFAWVTPEKASVFDAPAGKAIDTAVRRQRLPILEDRGEGKGRWVRVGEGRWMKPVDLNEARLLPRPDLAAGNDHWIDVDLGEQVLVAYEGDKPVYATLVSSGRAMPTPRGDYPVWAKVSHITMKSQPYEDKQYYVDRVPWALFFQAHNAIHGAYWHDKFGVSKSHGCINAAPRDARWLFEWLPPQLPPGWSGSRTPDLLEGPVVHVRNSRLKVPVVQERPIGPPDREDEKMKREEADARRLAEAQAAAAAVATGAPAGTTGPSPADVKPPAVVTPTGDPR